jgi:hypothetical protein
LFQTPVNGIETNNVDPHQSHRWARPAASWHAALRVPPPEMARGEVRFVDHQLLAEPPQPMWRRNVVGTVIDALYRTMLEEEVDPSVAHLLPPGSSCRSTGSEQTCSGHLDSATWRRTSDVKGSARVTTRLVGGGLGSISR